MSDRNKSIKDVALLNVFDLGQVELRRLICPQICSLNLVDRKRLPRLLLGNGYSFPADLLTTTPPRSAQ